MPASSFTGCGTTPRTGAIVGADVPDERTMALRPDFTHEVGFAEQVVRCVVASLRVVGPLRIGPIPTHIVDQLAEPVDQRDVDLLVVSGPFRVIDGVRGSPAEPSVGLRVQPREGSCLCWRGVGPAAPAEPAPG